MKAQQHIRNWMARLLSRCLASQLNHSALTFLCGWIAVGAVSLVICAYSLYFTDTILVFPRNNVRSMVEILIVFLGVTTAILITAFMTAHVQERAKRDAGFETILESLGLFKGAVSEFRRGLEQIADQETQAEWVQWWVSSDGLIKTLDSLTPLWRGYDDDVKLEGQLDQYVKEWTTPISLVAPDELRLRHEQAIRSLVIGLRVLDEATVERRFAGNLIKIFASLICTTDMLSARTNGGWRRVWTSRYSLELDQLIHLRIPTRRRKY